MPHPPVVSQRQLEDGTPSVFKPIQALTKRPGFDFDEYRFAQQCDLMVLVSGFDYYCSINSGWSLNGVDQYGQIVPDNANIFTWY